MSGSGGHPFRTTVEMAEWVEKEYKDRTIKEIEPKDMSFYEFKVGTRPILYF
jgi:hypothetical protein